ncbi:daunorubicin resistance ABC transporter ATP-binding subunit [Thermoplasmatales archaeon SCGC AB-540-F20]|nr:daunorubicin resistance ABC transporter ATP-binding subunit [Thermoplasmatales archaeon SCGC AB-540-F20]
MGDRILEIIKTNNLTKKFNDFTAVDHISFSVRKGEIFGFLGPNGAGKTTTIKMLTTLLYPTEGSAELSGFNVIKKRDDVRKHIGVVFQEPALDTELTGRENLDFHARIYGLNKDNRKKRAAEVLKLVDLEGKKDVLVKNYSGGMKRRLEIARGLMHYPTVLFLDEPTLGLDTQTRRAIWEYIKKMNKEEKTTIFLTTHYMDEADYLCDRVGIIDHGKILVIDSTTSLKNAVGNDVITLSCSDLDELGKRLGDESWIKNIKQHDTFLTLGVKKGEEKIPVVFEIARNLNIKIKSISVRKPTLDDVFLHFTGRTMRGQEERNTGRGSIPPRFRSRRR